MLRFCNALLQNYAFFGDKTDPEIHIYDKVTLNHISSYRLQGIGGITDMTMAAPDVQPLTTSKIVTHFVVVK